jgi:hypothetical protein
MRREAEEDYDFNRGVGALPAPAPIGGQYDDEDDRRSRRIEDPTYGQDYNLMSSDRALRAKEYSGFYLSAVG